MSLTVKIILTTAFIISIVIPFGAYILGEKSKKSFKNSLFSNLFFFACTMVVAIIMMWNQTVYAAEETANIAANTAGNVAGFAYIAAALSTGLSCIGGGIAVSAAASSALGAISEDSSILGKSLIFVGLAEGVCLYGLIISFMILGKL
jgi:ATP synthase subunit C.